MRMEEGSKPFACTVDGCEMTFANEDHLNWHHKKHDMVLNLGLANKNAEVADQTPTPTRFIRNCEEVGLFQDLQNVNPFDETFKKAVESAKSGTLHVPEAASNDDTLHTPHIFPHVEGTTDKYVDSRNDNQSTQSTDFCITSVASIQENSETNEVHDLTVDADDSDNTKKRPVKDKLKEAIINKGKITPVPLEKLITSDVNKKKRKAERCDDDEKEKIRESNRAAQLRCRKRKRIKWEQMEDDIKDLKAENVKLNLENQNFRQKFSLLKELLIKEKIDNANEDNPFLAKIENILTSSSTQKKGPLTTHSIPILRHKPKNKSTPPPLLPIPFVQTPAPGQPVQKPVLIQVMGSVQQLAVSVLPSK